MLITKHKVYLLLIHTANKQNILGLGKHALWFIERFHYRKCMFLKIIYYIFTGDWAS